MVKTTNYQLPDHDRTTAMLLIYLMMPEFRLIEDVNGLAQHNSNFSANSLELQ